MITLHQHHNNLPPINRRKAYKKLTLYVLSFNLSHAFAVVHRFVNIFEGNQGNIFWLALVHCATQTSTGFWNAVVYGFRRAVQRLVQRRKRYFRHQILHVEVDPSETRSSSGEDETESPPQGASGSENTQNIVTSERASSDSNRISSDSSRSSRYAHRIQRPHRNDLVNEKARYVDIHFDDDDDYTDYQIYVDDIQQQHQYQQHRSSDTDRSQPSRSSSRSDSRSSQMTPLVGRQQRVNEQPDEQQQQQPVQTSTQGVQPVQPSASIVSSLRQHASPLIARALSSFSTLASITQPHVTTNLSAPHLSSVSGPSQDSSKPLLSDQEIN